MYYKGAKFDPSLILHCKVDNTLWHRLFKLKKCGNLMCSASLIGGNTDEMDW